MRALASVPIMARPEAGTEADWAGIRSLLVRWHICGCAMVRSPEGEPLDVATLRLARPEDLDGTTLVIYHSHVLTVCRAAGWHE